MTSCSTAAIMAVKRIVQTVHSLHRGFHKRFLQESYEQMVALI